MGGRVPRCVLGHALGALALLLVALSTAVSPARAADAAARITHVEPSADGIRLLVSVPADASPDLARATVTVAGRPADATATLARSQAVVRRTAILAIDTSDSMAGARIRAAKAAAHEYLAALPDDVYLGIVSFAGRVTTELAPSRDRTAAAAIIDRLTLSHGTKLYDAVGSAVRLAGTRGQRSLLVLSDGADVGSAATLAQTAATVGRAKVLADVVAVDERGRALGPLRTLARAAKGEVLAADPTTLQQRFQAEADMLADQVLVTVHLPAGFTGTSAQVEVTLPSADGDSLTAAALATGLGTATREPAAAPTVAGPHEDGFVVPSWGRYAAVAAVGLAVLVLLVTLVPAGGGRMSPEDRVTAYAAAVLHQPTPTGDRSDADRMLASATKAAGDLLRRNRSLEARISARLDAAGSQLRPAEWLLLHLGIAVGAALLGLVVGGTVGGFVLLALGAVGPWAFLAFRRGRREKQFGNVLPDTLQLISASLSAGLSLTQAVDTVVREGQEPIAAEFKRVMVENRLGVSLEDALDGLAERFRSKDFAWVVMAIKIQRQVGGNLAELLDTVAATMRERQYLRRQVDALAAEGKLSAAVLAGLPPVFMLYLLLTQRDYVSVMFTDPRGLIMLAGATFWLLVGIFWMKKIIKVEV